MIDADKQMPQNLPSHKVSALCLTVQTSFITVLPVRHYSSQLLWHSPAVGSWIPGLTSPHSHTIGPSQFLLFASFRNVVCHSIDELADT